MLTRFYRWQTEPQGDEGACLGPPGGIRSRAGKEKALLSNFSSRQFPAMKLYSF